MPTRTKHNKPAVAVAGAELVELPVMLVVVEGTLTVGTDDDMLAMTLVRGMGYLLAREFMRQQPGLALLYDLEVVLLGTRRGSLNFDFKVVARLKKRIRSAYKNATAAQIAGVIMASPAAALAAHDVYLRLFPPVEQCLRSDMPQIEIHLHQITVRPPDARDSAPKEPRTFTL